jgi:hypothetical protein
MVKRIGIALAVLVCLGTITLGSAEVYHRFKFGHFLGYGLHTDVFLGNSDVGTNDMYYAQLWNLSASNVQIEGCLEASDVGGVPDSVLYRWDVQKWDLPNQRWISLHGADTWVHTAFGGYWKEEPCRPTKTWLKPLESRKRMAWVYKDWVTSGEPVRIALHTSVTASPDEQRIIYTKTFVVKPPASAAN